MRRMDATDSLEPSTAPLQLSHTVRWIPWILCSSNTVAQGPECSIYTKKKDFLYRKGFFVPASS